MKMKTGFSLLTICVASLAAINVYAAERTTLNEEAMFNASESPQNSFSKQ